MAKLAALLILLFSVSVCLALTQDEIVRLSKSGTSEELILQMIQKSGLEGEVTAQDIVALKEQGVSDRVLEYIWKVSHPDVDPDSENMRSFYKTTKDGKKIRVFTNLDEQGKRMGPEPPPPMEEPVYEVPAPESAKEIHVTVEHRVPEYEDEGGQEYPVGPYDPGDYSGGIPVDWLDDPGYSYYPYPYYPQYPDITPCRHPGCGHVQPPDRPGHRPAIREPIVTRPRPTSPPQKGPRSVTGGTRKQN